MDDPLCCLDSLDASGAHCPPARVDVHYRGKAKLDFMFRRCVSLLVIAGFLASQLAAVPHAHGGASPEGRREHDAAPHFHWAWLSHAAHHHDHSHSPSGHEHSHSGPQSRDQNDSKGSSGEPIGPPQITGLPGAGHDADAIFVSGQTAAASPSKDQASKTTQLIASVRLVACLDGLALNPRLPPCWHPSDEALDASDTYLILRNLRI